MGMVRKVLASTLPGTLRCVAVVLSLLVLWVFGLFLLTVPAGRSVIFGLGLCGAAVLLRFEARDRHAVRTTGAIPLLIIVLLIVSLPGTLIALAIADTGTTRKVSIAVLLVSVLVSLVYLRMKPDELPTLADKCTFLAFCWSIPVLIVQVIMR